MNTHATKILHSLHTIYTQCKLWFKKLPAKEKIAFSSIVGATLIGAIFLAVHSTKSETDVVASSQEVTLASVASLSNLEGDFPLIGTVTSVSEATIRSEGGGRLTHVYKKLGDQVYAGSVIAEFDNSTERASVLQAEGAYEQAKAGRTIAGLNNGQAGTSLIDTKNQAINTLSSAYISMDDAIHGKTDVAYSDAKFNQVKLLIAVPDAFLSTSLENTRKDIEKMLTEREQKNKTLTINSNLLTELTTIQNEAQVIKTYLDDLSTAYSKSIPDSHFNQAALDIGKSNTQSARQSISSTISSIVSSKSALSGSITVSEISGGASQSSGALLSSDAQVKQAQGAYNGALARLEKNIIRSPITGTLNSLTISTGDYIGAFTQVAVVSNNGALEVISYITEDDAKRIHVGDIVLIDSKNEGTVTRIASAIDPTTRKIEVHIGIQDTSSSLTNGQSVSVSITKNKKQAKEIIVSSSTPLIIPISALKLTPRGANVFIVSSSSTLVAIPVHEGAILGEQIQILEGLSGRETIVVDARGLKEGMSVTVK